MKTPILTRYLYHLTDVKFSLISCLLKSEDIKEVLFWASEIYYSGHTNLLYNIIWKVYYDFYAITNPLLESQINKLKSQKNNQTTNCIINEMKNLKIQETPNIKLQIMPLDNFDENENENEKYLIYILNILFNIDTIDYTVFELRFLNPLNPYEIIKKERKWLLKLKIELRKEKIELLKIEELLLISVYEENDNNILYYLSRANRLDEIYIILKRFYIFVKGFILNDNDNGNYLNTINYKNKHHIILSMICYFQLELKEINKSLPMEEYNETNYHSYFKNTNNNSKNIPYKVLKSKREYSINPNIGCFLNTIYKKNRIFDKNDILLNNWEYYCNFSPIWKERFIKYKCIFKNKTPIFSNNDLLEDFYKKYGYEPDEQNKETQLKSTKEIKENSVQNWLNYVFEQDVEFSESIKYIKDY